MAVVVYHNPKEASAGVYNILSKAGIKDRIDNAVAKLPLNIPDASNSPEKA